MTFLNNMFEKFTDLEFQIKDYAKLIPQFDEVIKFIPDNKKMGFVNNVKHKWDKNKNCFKELKNNLLKLKEIYPDIKVCKTMGKLIFYALGDPKVDINATLDIKGDKNDKSTLDILSKPFKVCGTYSSKKDYERYEKGDTLGNRIGIKWLMSWAEASELWKELLSATDCESRINHITKELSLAPATMTKDGNAPAGCVLTKFDNDKLKKDSEIVGRCMAAVLPDGSSGGNQFWLPGGMTGGGKLEMIANRIPNRYPYVIEKKFMNFETGETEHLPIKNNI